MDMILSIYSRLDSYYKNIIHKVIIVTLCGPATWPASMKIYSANYFANTLQMCICEYFLQRKCRVLQQLNVISWHTHVYHGNLQMGTGSFSGPAIFLLFIWGDRAWEWGYTGCTISWYWCSVGCVWSVVCSVALFQCWWRRMKRLRDSCTYTHPSMKMQPGRWSLIPRLPCPQLFISCSEKLSWLAREYVFVLQ